MVEPAPNHGNAVPDPAKNNLSDASGARSAEAEKWASVTDAQVLTGAEFTQTKEAQGLHVAGVIGFSGQWSEEKISSDPQIRADAEQAQSLLRRTLLYLKEQHGEALVVSSGATMEGVPRMVYEECEALGISAMGVACAKAANYTLGKMAYFIPEGQEWGDESQTFLETSDEIIMIGGGGQAKREAIATSAGGKPLTVFRGFGGSADDLEQDDVPGARFVNQSS